jgi:hypothetical protein
MNVVISDPKADFFVLGNPELVITRRTLLLESNYREYKEYASYDVTRNYGQWGIIPNVVGEHTMPEGWALCVPTVNSLHFIKGLVKGFIPAKMSVSSYSIEDVISWFGKNGRPDSF